MNFTTQVIERDLNENTQELLGFLNQIEDDSLTRKPNPEKWSILETYDHLITLEGLLIPIFNGPTSETDRDPSQMIQQVEKAFYNYERRYTAMPPIQPQGKVKSKDEVETQLLQIRQELIQLGNDKGWSMICEAFPHPKFGAMTRWEWVHFCIIHANRHLTLMEKVQN